MTGRNLTHLATLLLVLLLTSCGADEKPEALISSAKSLLAKNQTNAAIIQLRNALQKNPDLAEGRFLLGKAELETGDLAGAQKELRTALELKYPPDAVIPPLAEAMLLSGEFKRVVDEFGKAEAKAPEAPSADLPAALTAAMQQMGEARKEPDKSDAVAVTGPEARAALQTIVGKAQLALRNPEAAGAAFAAALAAKPDYPPALVGQAQLAAAKGDLPGALLLLGSALAKSPQFVEGWEFQGQIQLAQGQPEDALASYRKALDAKRDYLPAHSAIVSLLADQGKFEEASKQLDAMREIAPKAAQTLYLQAQLAHQRQDYTAARESIQQVLAVAPENLNALLLAGAIDFELKSYTQAEGSLIKVLSAAPDQPFARRLLVGTYLRTGQPGKALEALKPVLDKIDNNSDLLTLAGEVYMRNGNAKEASRYFEKAATLDPKDTSNKTSLALVHMAQGDTGKAMRELEQTVREDTTTRSDLALIALHIRQREYAKALTAIDALEKKEPANPLPSVLRGAILQETNDIPGARKSFERALAINPAYFPAAERLAQLDLADKKPDDARKRMDAVLANDPKQTQALLAIAEMRAMAGAPADEVAALIGKAIAANPSDVAPHLALITHYLRSKDTKKAIAAGQDALAAIPDRPEILEALGQAQQAAGDPNQAIATYSKWARLRPSSPLPLLRLAEAQTAAKDPNAALQSLRKALEIKPDLIEAQRAIMALDLAADRMPQALAAAREVQKQRPKEAVGFLLEGDIYASKKDWGAAAAAYRAGFAQDKATAVAMRLHGALLAGGDSAAAQKFATTWVKDHPKDNMFLFYVANSALINKDFITAHQYYRALVEINPKDIVALNNLAWTAGQVKDPKALEYAEKANQLVPNEPAVMDTLATLLLEKGDTGRGLELLRKASGIAPNEPALRLKLAQNLIKANQKDAAKKELEELAKLGDKFPAQAEVTKLMQGL